MNSKLESAQDKFIESIGKMCDSFGLNRFIAQLYAVLYLSDKPLSLDDLMGKLKVSKGSISLNIRELEKWGAVKNIWIKGSRRDYYEANLDVKNIIANKIKSGIQKRANEVSSMLDEFNAIVRSAGGELTEEEQKTAKLYQERMKNIEELKSIAISAINLADKFLSVLPDRRDAQ
ncbi:MAG: HTH domain-containing protein [Candidatus Omnitrophica bacterium]|nr:HTH domain-containing protein [Candidatus Omnitrophota bacterium]